MSNIYGKRKGLQKKHETKIKKALDILDEVRKDLLKIEKENGLKAPKGYRIRFSIDSIFENEDLGFLYRYIKKKESK